MIELDEIRNVNADAKSVLEVILKLDEEYEKKAEDLSTPGYYFTNDVLKKIGAIDDKMCELSFEGKLKLAQYLDYVIVSDENRANHMMIKGLDEGIHLILDEKKRIKGKTR